MSSPLCAHFSVPGPVPVPPTQEVLSECLLSGWRDSTFSLLPQISVGFAQQELVVDGQIVPVYTLGCSLVRWTQTELVNDLATEEILGELFVRHKLIKRPKRAYLRLKVLSGMQKGCEFWTTLGCRVRKYLKMLPPLLLLIMQTLLTGKYINQIASYFVEFVLSKMSSFIFLFV